MVLAQVSLSLSALTKKLEKKILKNRNAYS